MLYWPARPPKSLMLSAALTRTSLLYASLPQLRMTPSREDRSTAVCFSPFPKQPQPFASHARRSIGSSRLASRRGSTSGRNVGGGPPLHPSAYGSCVVTLCRHGSAPPAATTDPTRRASSPRRCVGRCSAAPQGTEKRPRFGGAVPGVGPRIVAPLFCFGTVGCATCRPMYAHAGGCGRRCHTVGCGSRAIGSSRPIRLSCWPALPRLVAARCVVEEVSSAGAGMGATFDAQLSQQLRYVTPKVGGPAASVTRMEAHRDL